MNERVIGILGGMGPEATVELYYRIIRTTNVQRDQDHIKTIIYSNPKVPDRTKAILGNGESPLPEMIKTAKTLEKAGADFIIIPCNTAHYFINELRESVNIPILNMIELTAKKVKEEFPKIKRAGLIATDGTVNSEIYHKNFNEIKVDTLSPPNNLQKEVMKAIYEHIKKGDLDGGRKILLKVAENLHTQGSQIILCGCTEVSLVLKEGDVSAPILDPLQVLAETAVRVALEKMEYR